MGNGGIASSAYAKTGTGVTRQGEAHTKDCKFSAEKIHKMLGCESPNVPRFADIEVLTEAVHGAQVFGCPSVPEKDGRSKETVVTDIP